MQAQLHVKSVFTKGFATAVEECSSEWRMAIWTRPTAQTPQPLPASLSLPARSSSPRPAIRCPDREFDFLSVGLVVFVLRHGQERAAQDFCYIRRNTGGTNKRHAEGIRSHNEIDDRLVTLADHLPQMRNVPARIPGLHDGNHFAEQVRPAGERVADGE